MTHKEKIIATAYTGIMFVDGSDIREVYEYEEEKLGDGVIDIMHATDEFRQEVRNAVKSDFLAMLKKQEETNLSLDNLIMQIQVLVTAWNFGGIDKTGYKNVEDYVKDKLNYTKQIDEEELSELAWNYVESIDIPCRYEESAIEAYKAGYRKAMGE